MAKVANFQSPSNANLLRDISRTDSRSGVAVEIGTLRDICILENRFAIAEPLIQYALGGLCRCRAEGVDIEVEMVSWPDKIRSVLYLGAGQTLHAFIPPGIYSFRYRFFSPPGRYDASVVMIQVSLTQKFQLYMTKAWQLLRRGPVALRAAAVVMASRREGVVATRTAVAPVSPPIAVPSRAKIAQPRPGSLPRVSIIIPTRDRIDLLEPCIKSLRHIAGADREIIIVDNGTTEARTLAYLESLAGRANVTVVRHAIPFNFSRLCNKGAAHAKGDALLFLNDDIEAMDGAWLHHMMAWLSDPTVGTVGARLLYPSRDLQHAGIATNLVPGPGHPWRGAAPRTWQAHPLLNSPGEVDAVTGACLLVRHSDFLAAGGFDEDAFAITLNDVDLCLKLRRRGLKSLYVPAATLIHKEGQSRKGDYSPGELERRRLELKAFFQRYPDFARDSCFYPENLRRDGDQALPF
jgi:GT2 family glycosyltransferase